MPRDRRMNVLIASRSVALEMLHAIGRNAEVSRTWTRSWLVPSARAIPKVLCQGRMSFRTSDERAADKLIQIPLLGESQAVYVQIAIDKAEVDHEAITKLLTGIASGVLRTHTYLGGSWRCAIPKEKRSILEVGVLC